MFRWSLMVLVLAAIIAGLVVGALNPDSVQLNLIIFQASLPLGALVMAALTAGVLLGLVLALLLFVIPGRLSRSAPDKESGGGGPTKTRSVQNYSEAP